MNHGFVDGNKRVGFAATYVFLRLNGLAITASVGSTLAFVIGSLDAGTFKKEQREPWLRGHTRAG